MKKGIFLGLAALALVGGGYFLLKEYLEDEKVEEIKNKLAVVNDFISEKDLSIEKLASLTERITQLTKEVMDKSSEFATQKKESLLSLVEEAKKAIEEEKQRLKELRESLDKPKADL